MEDLQRNAEQVHATRNRTFMRVRLNALWLGLYFVVALAGGVYAILSFVS